jgi:hypothetical protein
MPRGRPAGLCRIVASLLPKQSEKLPNPLSEYTDAQLDKLDELLASLPEESPEDSGGEGHVRAAGIIRGISELRTRKRRRSAARKCGRSRAASRMLASLRALSARSRLHDPGTMPPVVNQYVGSSDEIPDIVGSVPDIVGSVPDIRAAFRETDETRCRNRYHNGKRRRRPFRHA